MLQNGTPSVQHVFNDTASDFYTLLNFSFQMARSFTKQSGRELEFPPDCDPLNNVNERVCMSGLANGEDTLANYVCTDKVMTRAPKNYSFRIYVLKNLQYKRACFDGYY